MIVEGGGEGSQTRRFLNVPLVHFCGLRSPFSHSLMGFCLESDGTAEREHLSPVRLARPSLCMSMCEVHSLVSGRCAPQSDGFRVPGCARSRRHTSGVLLGSPTSTVRRHRSRAACHITQASCSRWSTLESSGHQALRRRLSAQALAAARCGPGKLGAVGSGCELAGVRQGTVGLEGDLEADRRQHCACFL